MSLEKPVINDVVEKLVLRAESGASGITAEGICLFGYRARGSAHVGLPFLRTRTHQAAAVRGADGFVQNIIHGSERLFDAVVTPGSGSEGRLSRIICRLASLVESQGGVGRVPSRGTGEGEVHRV